MKVLTVILCMMLSLNVLADNGNGFFCSTEIDIGDIPATTDSCVATFSYWNQTGRNTVIEAVHTSCGCTSVQYTLRPIRKNETGTIRVAVSLRRETGHFEKTAVVYVAGILPTVLKVKGNVVHNHN